MNSSKVAILIDQATSNELKRPDTSLNTQVCKEIHQYPDNARIAAAKFKLRLATNEPIVIMLTLELLDLAMNKCGIHIHTQVGSKEFMNSLVILLNQKGFPMQVSKKVLTLIQKWGLQFENDSDTLPLFSQVYKALMTKGVQFPELQQAPSSSQQRIFCLRQEPVTQQQKPVAKGGKVSSKYEKLLQDMNLVKGNINLTNMMLDTAKPADLTSQDNPVNDLIVALKDMEPKLFELVSTLENEEMMIICLLVNDDLHKTFARYDKLKKGKKPEPFTPGESVQRTALVPTTIYEKPEVKAQRAQQQQQQAAQRGSVAQAPKAQPRVDEILCMIDPKPFTFKMKFCICLLRDLSRFNTRTLFFPLSQLSHNNLSILNPLRSLFSNPFSKQCSNHNSLIRLIFVQY